MTTAPDIAIRLRRASFNRALADADLNVIASILAPDVILVAGTDSAVISGRRAQLATWKQEFATVNRSIYVRKPKTVLISPAFPLAFEHGEWQSVSAVDGTTDASGPYTAKWRHMGADWLIEAELYLTMA